MLNFVFAAMPDQQTPTNDAQNDRKIKIKRTIFTSEQISNSPFPIRILKPLPDSTLLNEVIPRTQHGTRYSKLISKY